MKYIQLSIISLIAIFIIAACGGDVETCIDPLTGEICEPPPIPVYPSLVKVDSLDFKTDDFFLEPSEEFTILLRGRKGDEKFTSLEIRENGQLLDLARMTIDGTPLRSNPYIFSNTEEADMFLWEVGLVAQDTKDKVQYEFIIEDLAERQAITDIIVNTLINEMTPPKINLSPDSPQIIIGQGTVSFDIEVDAIGSPIESIAVYQAVNIVEPNRLLFGGDPVNSNPLILEGDDREGFKKTIEITSMPETGLQGYTIIFRDSLGVTYNEELGIQVAEPIIETDDVKLRSSENGNAFGALDLDNNTEFGVGNTNAEIKADTLNGVWPQKITAINNAEISKLDADKYNSVFARFQLKNLWIQDDAISLSSIPGDPREYTTEVVSVDDVFLIKRVNTYQLIWITAIDPIEQSFTMKVKK